VPHYVLHDFAKADAAWLDPLLEAIADNTPLLAENQDSTFSNRLHEALADQQPEKRRKSRAASTGAQSAQGTESNDTPKREGPLAWGLRKLFGS
jgi:PTH1 family peptidyl-tRNA hydrolase